MTEKFDEQSDDDVFGGQIIEFARQYHAEDFPNPGREDCPPKNLLIKTAVSADLPDESLRLHLLNCSPCFQDFQIIRSEKTTVLSADAAETTQKQRLWTSFFRQPLIAATAVILLVGTLAIALFFALRAAPPPDFAGLMEIKPPQDAVREIQPDSETVKPKPENNQIPENAAVRQPSESNKPKNAAPKNQPAAPEYSTKAAVNLDLAKAAVTRNSGGSKETIYPLKADTVKFNVKLPADSPAGIYEILLFDEFGKPLIDSAVKTSNGKNVQFELDLQKISGRARLCIAPKGEIPDCLAVKVGNAP